MKTKNILLLFTLLLIFTSCWNKQKPEVVESIIFHPEWSYNSTIYEVNIRQYTAEGTFTAFDNHLPRLKELGVNILWIMPVQSIGEQGRKGSLGSYYSIQDYTEVNPNFGTLEDFKNTVRIAHQEGMKVILDWVANHTSRDAVWTKEHPSWYELDSLGNIASPYDWTDVAKLNYSNNEMRKAMTDAMLFWIKETDIDGFRCDVAGEVPTDFWEATIGKLKEAKPDLFMLAEAEKPELVDSGFDSFYAWDLHHKMNNIAQGKENVDSLRKCIDQMYTNFPTQAVPMIFTSNHDENSWNGTEFERMGDAAKAFAALSYTLPGIPLIYSGQEVGFNRRLQFFEKDTINWTDQGKFTFFYQTLIHLRKANKALYSPEKGGSFVELTTSHPHEVYAFKREKEDNIVIAAFNFSPQEKTATINNNLKQTFKSIDNDSITFNGNIEIKLPPWGYKIWYK